MGRTFLLYAMIGCLVMSVAGIVYYKMFKALYGKELLTRLDPVNEFRKKDVFSADYAFIGDSRIAHWDLSGILSEYGSYVNLGIDGQTSKQVLLRSQEYFKNYNVNTAFIQVGVNDLKAIGFYPHLDSLIIKNAIDNIQSVLTVCLKNNSKPVYVTIFPTGKVELVRRPFWNEKIEMAVVEVNKQIMKFCKEKNIYVFDAHGILRGEDGKIKMKYQKDCLHLNKEGYDALNAELDKLIKQAIFVNNNKN